MQYRIRIFSSFCDSRHGKNAIEIISLLSQKISYYGQDKRVYITDGEDYTHVIIWNTAMPEIRRDIPKENVIGFAYEPIVYLGLHPGFIEYAKKYIHKYYIGDAANLPAPFIEGNCYLTYNPPLQSLLQKKQLISLMISNKQQQPGHQYRHVLASHILKTDLPVDIYGRGCTHGVYQNDHRIKGVFKQYEPYDGYEFHICIENVQSGHYFSEKIINSLLTDTTPIYLGCKNIDTYFPNNVIKLTGNIEHDMNLICDICINPNKYRKQIDVVEIERKVSLLHNIEYLYNSNDQ